MNSALTPRSSNAKTGPIAVSTTSRDTCPTTCPLRGDGGCYAEAGYHTRLHWDAITAGSRGVSTAAFIEKVGRLRPSTMFRHNVAGDLWHNAGKVDFPLAMALARACAHLRAAWTYTHHLLTASNRLTLLQVCRAGLTVNVSTESLDSAADATRLGLPAVCVVPRDTPAHFRHNDVLFRQCPATFEGSPTTCATCGNGKPLCSLGQRDFVVTFPAHGSRAAMGREGL